VRKCVRWFGIAAALLLPVAAVAQVQVNQTFIPQGPSPKFGPIDVVQSGDAPPNGTVAGAVQTILLDPALGPQTMFIGGVNGGIWRTTDGGATWKALTDRQASPSIASLALDPTDPTGKTLIAGIGITSNGGWSYVGGVSSRGGARTGVLYSTDGGETWSARGGGPYLTGQSVIGVAAVGDTILAATFEEQEPRRTIANSGASYGLYLSTDRGQSFNLVQASQGLPAGPVTALVADPQNASNCAAQRSCTFFASITSSGNPQATGIYISRNSGHDWSPCIHQHNTGQRRHQLHQLCARERPSVGAEARSWTQRFGRDRHREWPEYRRCGVEGALSVAEQRRIVVGARSPGMPGSNKALSTWRLPSIGPTRRSFMSPRAE
jgi:hypothetical protein